MSKNMKKATNKRQAQLAAYERAKKELKQELIEKGEWVCFFSGTPLPEEMPFKPHHLRGRREEMLVHKDFLVPCLWEYHRKWHDEPLSKLRNEIWFDGFMDRLKAKDRDGYIRVQMKLNDMGE